MSQIFIVWNGPNFWNCHHKIVLVILIIGNRKTKQMFIYLNKVAHFFIHNKQNDLTYFILNYKLVLLHVEEMIFTSQDNRMKQTLSIWKTFLTASLSKNWGIKPNSQCPKRKAFCLECVSPFASWEKSKRLSLLQPDSGWERSLTSQSTFTRKEMNFGFSILLLSSKRHMWR